MTDKPNDDKHSLIGRTIDHGRYEITRLIGEGGMGRVYEARQVSMNRLVALKILRTQLASDEQLLARFQQEALSISRLRHPNTITIYDYGKTEDDLLFMAMELLGGQSLFSILRKEKRMALPRALHIMDQVAGAVGEAHQLGIVHRDLKPENIQVDHVASDPDFAKVLDFGIAKIVGGDGRNAEGKTLTLAGSIFGTPHYMSPEQVHGQRVDHRTDLYSLGIILFEMLAGKPPFDGNTPMAVMMAQASKEMPDIREMNPEADVNDAVMQLIRDCTVKDRARRLRTADDLITRLRQIQLDLGEISSTNSRLYIAAASGIYRLGQMRASDRVDLVEDGSAPRAGGRATPPGMEGDGQITPEHSGHLATVPPVGTPQALAPVAGNGRALRWIGVAVVLLGIATGVILWNREPPPTATPITQVEDDPGRIQINAQSIRYTIESVPPGAEVYADGVFKGTTPLEYDQQRGRSASLSLRLEGYIDQEHPLNGQGLPEQKVQIALKQIEPAPPATAWLQIGSEPDGADVFLGEEKIGTTPFTWEPVISAEPVELVFKKAGFDELTREVNLATRGEAAVDVKGTLTAQNKPIIRRRGPVRPANATNDPPPTQTNGKNPRYEKL
ncbi:MAG: serine/threonine protein kinase [Myxococcales bacterium]|nr:serine/threonine protein kinase [Myxococcales bacterium]